MKTRTYGVILLSLLFAATAYASNVKRQFQDIKLPTQAVMEHQVITDPIAAGTTDVASALAGNSSAAAVVTTSGLTNPDVPRNLVITPGGSTGDVASCTVTVAGTDYLNGSISEDFAFAANASSATTGSKAFKTVTSVTFPALCEDAPYVATWSIGVGEKLGLSRCLSSAGMYVFSVVGGVYESTRGTVAANATAVSSNTIDLNGTMNGSNDFDVFFVQNFRCTP